MTAIPAVAAVTTELDETERWLYDRLTKDTGVTAAVAGRVFGYVAPALTVYPFLLFSWQGDHDVQTHDGSTIWVEAVYTVQAIGEGRSAEAIGPAAAALHYSLQGASGLTPSGRARVISCLRDSSLTMGELTGGRQYRHVGGQYRIRTQLIGT